MKQVLGGAGRVMEGGWRVGRGDGGKYINIQI